MNTSSRARPLSLQRSWTRRALDCGAGALGRWLDRSRAVLVRWQQARRLRREHAALRELDAATLRDLGAPPWLQSEAQAHSDALSFERDVLRLHGGMAKGRFD